MKVSKSGFYKWYLHKDLKYKDSINLEEQIKKIHESSRGTYGRRRILSTLRKSFINIGHKKVSKIMHKLNLCGVGKPRFKVTTKVSKQSLHSPNLIGMNFKTEKADELWTSDITYIPTKEGWVYLCVILDTYSRAVIGWSMQENLKQELILNSLNMAFQNRKQFKPGIIFHSDKGSQYSSKSVRKYLLANKFLQSMSNSCYENSITETFFATLKKELVHRCKFYSRNEAKSAIFEYIESFYNRLRAHSAIEYMAPLEYEMKA
jgi:transposase InsO family protein